MSENTKQNEGKKLVSGLGWSFAERMLAQAVSLVISLVLARILAPEHYGIISIVTVFISIGDALVVGGFGNALVQKKDATDQDFDSICWVSMGVSLIIYILLFFGAPLVAAFYEEAALIAIIRVMGLKFVFSAFNSVQQAYVQKRMLFKKFFFATLGGSLASSVVGIGMALSGFGVWALVGQYLTKSVMDTVVMFCIIRWKPKLRICWKSVRELWGFGAKVLGATLVYTVRDNIRTLLVGKRFTTEDLAYYNQGQKFPSLVVVDIVSSLEKVLYPALAEKQTETEKLRALMRYAVSLSSYIVMPLIFGLFAVSDTFVLTVLTEKWMPCVPFMRIMCVVYATRPLSAIFQRGLLAMGKSALSLIHEIVTSSVTIAGLFVAVFCFESVEMIAWNHVLVMMLGLSLYVYWGRKFIGYKIREVMKDFLPTALLATTMALSVWGVGLLNIVPLLKLILQVLAGMMVYISLSALTGNKNYKTIMSFVKGFLKKGK